jgi:multidrug efflux pump subunit AcrB
MKRVMAAFAGNTVFANILLVLILMAGAIAAVSMTRENYPEFSVDVITISVAYPGADPEEVEEGISRKIEEALEGLEGVKEYTTESRENAGITFIEVKENYDINDVLDRVRSAVDAVSTFPKDAEEPVITEITTKDPMMILYLSGDMSERSIKEWAESIKDEIQQLPELSQITVLGARDYEIAIEVSEERLREYNLTFNHVVEAVRRSNLNRAGGTIRTQGEEIRVRTVGRKYSGKELSRIVVLGRPEGEIVTLDRLAVVDDGFTENPIRAMINGEPSVVLVTYKTKEEDALAISGALKNFVAEKQSLLPPGAHLKILYDNTDMLRARIHLLMKNGAMGLSIVFFVLWIFLNGRLSFWCGMGIPTSIFGALAIVWAAGGTINMITLLGLILVLGIVVDDAVVVGEAIYEQRKSGLPPLKAAVAGVCEVGMPVSAAVLTSVVTFLPLAYVGGVMGKFIAILPVVVISCLVISLVECLLLLPAHLSDLPASDINRR